MALSLDQFSAASKPQRSRCAVTLLLSSLDPKDHAVLSGALADPSITASAIESVLKAQDPPVNLPQGTITRHRRGACTCGS